ncbi:uncharacterized protein LOC134741789 [Cydia strobilella]|uniref:uncharacterized protein LOC134741789 n=1 Tax=Cydia strobilella TaxID=1100964 RepID=UPI003007EC7A
MVVIKNKNKVEAILKTHEYLSSDILEEDYVKIFKPYRLIQEVLGSCRVDIKYRFVTAPSFFKKCYTIVGLVSSALGTFCLMKNYWKRRYIDRVMIGLNTFGVSGLIAIFLISIFHARFCNNKGNVQLHVKMQETNNLMKLHNNKVNNLQYKINSLKVLALVIAFVLFMILSFVITEVDYTFYEIIMPSCALICFVVELISTASCIEFFSFRVRLINAMIINHLRMTVGPFKYFSSGNLLVTDFVQLIAVAVVKCYLLCTLCIQAERFSREVKKTKKLSIIIISRYINGPLMLKAKKMIDIIEETPPSFYVYGMWRLDAWLLLTMFNVITSWLVTLLQFAFL